MASKKFYLRGLHVQFYQWSKFLRIKLLQNLFCGSWRKTTKSQKLEPAKVLCHTVGGGNLKVIILANCTLRAVACNSNVGLLSGFTGATWFFATINVYCLSTPGYSNYVTGQIALSLASPNRCT